MSSSLRAELLFFACSFLTSRIVLLCKQVPKKKADGLTLHSDDNSRFGLVLKLKLYCDNCGTVVNDVFTSERSLNDKKFSINTSAVVASSLCGIGPLTFNNFCEHLDLPGLSAKNFYNRTKSIYKDAEDVRQALHSKTIRLVRKEHAKNSNSALSDDDILDIAVSFDGTWMTRGHKSMIGVSCVIDVLTGYVIDFEVLSSFCQTCSTTGTRLKAQSPALYKEWFESHKPDCDINYTGSSGMMETHAAETLWRRSIEKFHYTTMLSDGDSKAFNKVCEIKPHGEVPITKEECVNHVGKRMGTALRFQNLHTSISNINFSYK
uniref:Mutator-like transposase domain-containing protein n=1 Tax=Biomphalaria glabrata TaxID=6526 RepID=A0A2C9JZT0_BIOGL